MDARLACPLSMGEVPSECRSSPARVLFRRRCRTSISSGSSTSPWSLTSMSISEGNARRIALELGVAGSKAKAGLSGSAWGLAEPPNCDSAFSKPGDPDRGGGVLAPFLGDRLPDRGGVESAERPDSSSPALAFRFLALKV